MKGLRRQLSLLGTAPGFRLLFLATMGSSLGTLLATVALVVDVKDRTNSGPWVGALMFVEFLPAVAVGLFFGPFLDRLPRRGVMIVSDLVRFGVFCVRQDIGAARDFGGRRIFFPIECRQSLPAQDQARRLVFRAEDDAIRFGDLVRIRGA